MIEPDRPHDLPAEFDEQSVVRSLFSAYPDALLIVGTRGTILVANPAAATLLGYPGGELIGLSVEELVPNATRPRHAAYRETYSRNPRPRPMGTQMELVAKRKDGSEVMVEIALSPLQSEGPPLVVAAIRDIGAYPRVRQALQRARYSEHLAQLGRLAVDARDPQVLLDQVPVIAAEALQVEQALVFLLEPNRLDFRLASAVGPVAGEEIGGMIPNAPRTPPGFVFAEGRPVVVADYRGERRFDVPAAYLAAGLTSALAVPLSERGRVIGSLTVRSTTAQRFGNDEVRFLESLSNLLATSLQRAQSEEALSHAQRLESVGQLTGGIAHDFNNLLTVILGNLEVLDELPALATDAHGRQLVGAAVRAARRGAELTSKLLAFARRQVLQPSAVDVPVLLHSLADMLRRTLDQHIRIEVDAGATCPRGLADPGQLEAALLNIAINARDAMPEGGTLRFSGALCRALPMHVHHELNEAAARPGNYVAIAIADSGSGMLEDIKERAFEPFFTTKAAGRGTGLGLSTVYGFAKQSRGAVAITSAPGAGTTVTLYIPCLPDPAAAVPEMSIPTDHVPPGLAVLLVEDDDDVREVVRAFLAALGCHVTDCASGEAALAALESDTGFDLLLSDIALGPGLRGTELAHRAQRRVPGLGVLLMSGFSAELLDADRDSPPAWELLRKPYSRGELARAICKVIGTGSEGP